MEAPLFDVCLMDDGLMHAENGGRSWRRRGGEALAAAGT